MKNSTIALIEEFNKFNSTVDNYDMIYCVIKENDNYRSFQAKLSKIHYGMTSGLLDKRKFKMELESFKENYLQFKDCEDYQSWIDIVLKIEKKYLL